MKETVSVEWLHHHQFDKDLIILDASLKNKAGGESTFLKPETIYNSRFIDLKNNFSDANSLFPNTLISEKEFEFQIQKLGVNTTSKIIVFDNFGIYSSPRVWWMLKIMGHKNVSVLDGGLPEWIKKGYKTTTRKTRRYQNGDFTAKFENKYVLDYDEILDNLISKKFTVIDARSEGRFNGIEKEPRKQLQSGHIPNSVNLPYSDVLEGGKFKSQKELQTIFNTKISNQEKVVFSCGSGLTASIIMLAYQLANNESKMIYDGSWAEWAEKQDLKIV